MVTVHIDGKLLNRVLEIERDDVSGYISLTFTNRKYIPRISRFKYHKVQLIYWSGDWIKASGVVITKGLKRRKNVLYLKISDKFMEKWYEV